MANYNPEAKFLHEGNSIDYTPGADVSYGEVIQLGTLLGVAAIDIAANKTGALHVEGVFAIAKEATTDTFAVGDAVEWDAANNRVIALATGAAVGTVIRAATATDTHVWVKLTPTSKV